MKAIVKLTYLINASYTQKYVPRSWKIAEDIMTLKPGIPSNESSSCKPISLLPVYQFGFRKKYATMSNHRLTNHLEKAFQEKVICLKVFLDVTEAFNKVCHQGLERKLEQLLIYFSGLQAFLIEQSEDT